MNKEDIYKCLKWPLSSNGTAIEGHMPINNLGDLNEFIIKHFKKIVISDDIPHWMDVVEQVIRGMKDESFVSGYFEVAKNLNAFEKCFLLDYIHSFLAVGLQSMEKCSVSASLRNVHQCYIRDMCDKGILSMFLSGDEHFGDVMYRLSPDCCGKLFKGHAELLKDGNISGLGKIILSDEIDSMCLFYEGSDQYIFDRLFKVILPGNYNRIVNSLAERHLGNGILCLLHGLPGTGKTEMVRQLAKASGRDLFIADVSSLLAHRWGESEKNARKLFVAYNYMCKIALLEPIFLLDEADGILSKRTSVSDALDKAENVVQSVYLQELDNFKGILFATTNMIENIDAAFYRRFYFMHEVSNPGQESKYALICSSLPEIEASLAKEISEKYNFTGADVKNLLRHIVIQTTITGHPLTSSEILAACNRLFSYKEQVFAKKIGFK